MAKAVRAINGMHQFMTRTTEQFEKRLSEIVRNVEMEIRVELQKLDLAANGVMKHTTENIQRLMTVRRELQVILGRAGYTQAVGEFLVTQDDILKYHAEVAKDYKIPVEFNEEDKASIMALKDAMTMEFASIGLNATTEIARVLDSMRLEGMTVAQAAREIKGVLDSRLQRYAKTYAETALSIYDRTLNAITFPTNDEAKYIYVGPLDAATRPFCQQYVGKVLTIAEIRQLDNGQLPNVFLTGGGYNCRHRWLYYPDDSDIVNIPREVAEAFQVEIKEAA